MKWLLVLCLILHTVQCQSFGSTTSCDTSANQALDSLRVKSGMPSYQISLKTDTTMCKGEWDKFHTCCEGKPLKNFLTDRVTRVNRYQWNNYFGKLYTFRTKLFPSVQKFVQKIANNKVRYRSLAMVEQRKTGGCSMSLYSDSFIDMLNAFLSNFELFLSTFKSDATTCFRKLSVFRSNAACAICSGRGAQLQSTSSSRYRYGQRVLKITSDTCSSLMSSCGKVFRFNFFLSHTIQIIQAYRSTYGKAKKARTCSNKFDQYQMDQLSAAFTQCLSTNFVSCSFANLGLLCESFVNFEDPNPEAEGDPSLLHDEANEDTANMANSVDSSRLLQGVSSGGVEVVSNSDMNAVSLSLATDTSTGLADSKLDRKSV